MLPESLWVQETSQLSLRKLTAEKLRLHIRRLKRELRKAELNLSSRNPHAEMQYECEICGFRHKQQHPVMKHLEKVHGYPEEDAGLSTHVVYV